MSNLPQHIGSYRLERKIGRGATSEVWLAQHTYLEKRRAAVKILMSHDEDTVLRFRREAIIASLLNHPNIVEIYDHGNYQTARGQFSCTMLKYVHGGSLNYLLEQQSRLPLEEAVSIFKQIGEALDYAHSLDIIHRDVSPGNILIEQTTRQALLTDFGIARDLNRQMTVAYSVMGTPGYWSPEHMRSATEVTHLSDIYSLGMVLYMMLSGNLPWDDDTLPKATREDIPPLQQRGAIGIPSEVDRVLQALLAPDPTRRYPTASAATEQLERIVSRHRTVTRVTPSASAANPSGAAGGRMQASGSEPDDVEAALGADLVRAPLVEAHQRAEELRDPAEIAALLDEWAAQSRFRRANLGRMARPHTVRSYNVYFYTLRVLYEQRGEPEPLEEPDYTERKLTLQPELTTWQVAVAPVQGFESDPGGQVVIPGTTRVISCDDCAGRGKHLCKRCNGNGRIYETREVLVQPPGQANAGQAAERRRQQPAGRRGAALSASQTRTDMPDASDEEQPASAEPIKKLEQVVVPCPDCAGSGGLTCERCDGVSRLVQQQAFRWQRTPAEFSARDDLLDIDEDWLYRHCEVQEIYREQATGNVHINQPATRLEWRHIPPLRALLEQAQGATSETSRIVFSEVTVSFAPVSDVLFDLGQQDRKTGEPVLYRLLIYGFENIIPSDWRFLNWERVIYLVTLGFLAVVVLMFGFFLFVL